MNKQLIERIVVECAEKAKLIDHDKKLIYFSELFIRIDAERGKVATGWFVNVNRDCDPDNPHFQQVAKQYEGDPDTFPLFLSPTIPEGYVLVPIEPTKKMVEAIDAVMWPGASEKAYRGMIAAAQGEK